LASAVNHDVRVENVAVVVYEVPTDQPEADGTIAWSSTTLVVVGLSGGGLTGLGYTYAGAGCRAVVEGPLAQVVTGRAVLDVAGAWQAMVRAVRNLGRPGLVSCAISAVDTALWDLKAKLLGLPVCRLLGATCKEVPVYGSSGFTTYDDAAAAQLQRWVGDWEIPLRPDDGRRGGGLPPGRRYPLRRDHRLAARRRGTQPAASGVRPRPRPY
jgi:L-alanine-DL-glutamate epimerase-like enolase superfamily enzyme